MCTAMVTYAPYREHFMVTSAQVRAARGLLNWTVRDLADRSGVHRNTVTRIETEATSPGHSLAAIQAALEAAGVEFIPENGGGAGVRLRKSPDRQLPNGEAGIIENNDLGAESYDKAVVRLTA